MRINRKDNRNTAMLSVGAEKPDGVHGTDADDIQLWPGRCLAYIPGKDGLIAMYRIDLDGNGGTTECVPFDLAANLPFREPMPR